MRPTLRESLKLTTRKTLARRNLDVSGDPFLSQVARMMASRGIEYVLDVGANEGQYAALLRSYGFRGQIHSFEPLTDAAARLGRRSARDPRWHAHQFGLGAEAGQTQINVAANSFSSSLLPMAPAHLAAAPESEYVGQEAIDLSTVDLQCQQLAIPADRTLLKIDTQGYESAVLAGGQETLARVAAVQLELSTVELYEGQVLAAELEETLAAAGLTRWTFTAGIADPEGRLLQYDALFVREP